MRSVTGALERATEGICLYRPQATRVYHGAARISSESTTTPPYWAVTVTAATQEESRAVHFVTLKMGISLNIAISPTVVSDCCANNYIFGYSQ